MSAKIRTICQNLKLCGFLLPVPPQVDGPALGLERFFRIIQSGHDDVAHGVFEGVIYALAQGHSFLCHIPHPVSF